MYHIPGFTPEAPTAEAAFGGNRPREVFRFGPRELRETYENLNATARDPDVDFVMLGCPHYSIEQIWEVCRLLQGKRVHENTELWIFTPRATRQIADQNGYTRIIEEAGGHLMSDTCSALGRVIPRGPRWRRWIRPSRSITCRPSWASRPGSAVPPIASRPR